ncbi:MAG: ATP-dependent helicase [Longispora sp.]|nr:ATP-dependent helicase [Longispora sp. (in: high G+C Gram-positive bacteria)]
MKCGVAYRLVRRPVSPNRTLALDPTQQSVVNHPGPLVVLGGPGSGKTTTLLAAVAARIVEGAPADRVLVWTSQRRTSATLRDEIAVRMGYTAADPLVRTPHGYAFSILRLAAARRGDPAPKLLAAPEQDLVMRELLRGALDDGRDDWPAGLRPALPTRGFVTELRDLLLRAVERGVSPERLAEWGRQYGRHDWVSAARFMDEYTDVRLLRDPNGYDPAELVRSAIAELRDDPVLLAEERARLRNVYVDDAQDLNPAQFELLRLISDTPVVFGDPDSAIFAFRGADASGLRGCADQTITLENCWRTGGALYAATQRLAVRLKGHGAQRRLAPRGDGEYEVALLPCASQEANVVAHRLRAAHLLDGVPWSRMAVIVRSTASMLGPLRRALVSAGVPLSTSADDLPLSAQPIVRALLTLIDCAVDPEKLTEDVAAMLLHSPLGGADPLAEHQLRQRLAENQLRRRATENQVSLGVKERPEWTNLIQLIEYPPEESWAEPARRIGALLTAARQVSRNDSGNIEDALWAVWDTSRLAERWEKAVLAGGERGAAFDRDLDAVVALFEAAGRFTDRLPGARPSLFVDHVLGQELPGDSLAPTADRGEAVQILTSHSAKGLEWDVVVVAGAQDGLWPNLKPRGSLLGSELLVDVAAGLPFALGASGGAVGLPSSVAALLDEERRLFYVAATRARRKLIVTAVANGEEQPSRFVDELRVRSEVPERTLVEFAPAPRDLTLAGVVAELRRQLPDPDAAQQLAALADAGVPGAHPDEWWGLRDLSDDRPLVLPDERVRVSPSMVDSVLTCGLRWFLARHGGEEASAAGAIGTLVHLAAEISERDGLDRDQILEEVRYRLNSFPDPAGWYAQRRKRDVEGMVTRLLDWAEPRRDRLIAVERDFRVTVSEGTELTGPVELAGRVDRLERDEDGRLVVFDYKTGREASCAETSRQLVAYQVAIEAGGFPEGAVSGGAALVRVRLAAPERRQPPLTDSDDPGWGIAVVREAAESMSGATLAAVAGSHCRQCPMKKCCPTQSVEVTS